MKRLFAILLLALCGAPAVAQPADDEAAVRAVIADWYQRVGRLEADAPWVLMAPGGIDDGPGYSVPADLHSGSAAIRGPFLNHEMAAKALKFSYEIDVLNVDPRFAKAIVWERGYFYASAAQKTYEIGVSTLFVFEKLNDGSWKILLHNATSQGIPPNRITDPMPDVRGLYYQRCGNACDPARDAAEARKGW
jgi:ketosteroid isomerase-like protein